MTLILGRQDVEDLLTMELTLQAVEAAFLDGVITEPRND